MCFLRSPDVQTAARLDRPLPAALGFYVGLIETVVIIIVSGLMVFGKLCHLIITSDAPKRFVYLGALLLGTVLGLGYFFSSGIVETGVPKIAGRNRALIFYGFLLLSFSLGLLLTYLGSGVLLRTPLFNRSKSSEQRDSET